MNWKDIGSAALHVLRTVAPTVAAAASGPFAPLVGPAVAAIFGVSADDPKAVETALLNASPDQLLALKKAENDFQVQMKQLGITQEQLVYADVANARAMNVANKDPTVRQIAWLNVGGFLAVSVFLIVAAVLWPDQVSKVPSTAWATLGTVLGYLAKSASQTEAFYFGSSAGSQAKDATIAQIAQSP